MEKKTITAVSAEMKAAIKNNTAFALPKSPSALGWKPDEIKEKLWRAIIGEDGSVMVELERVITEANEILSGIYGKLKNSITEVDYNAATGELSFKCSDGRVFTEVITLDLTVEGGEYDELNNKLILTLANGKTIRIDATKLLGEFNADGETLERYEKDGKIYFRLKPELYEIIRNAENIATPIYNIETSDGWSSLEIDSLSEGETVIYVELFNCNGCDESCCYITLPSGYEYKGIGFDDDYASQSDNSIYITLGYGGDFSYTREYVGRAKITIVKMNERCSVKYEIIGGIL